MAKLSVFNKTVLESFTTVGDMNFPGYNEFYGALSQGNPAKCGAALITIFQAYRELIKENDDLKARVGSATSSLQESYDKLLAENKELLAKVESMPQSCGPDSIVVSRNGKTVTMTAEEISELIGENARNIGTIKDLEGDLSTAKTGHQEALDRQHELAIENTDLKKSVESGQETNRNLAARNVDIKRQYDDLATEHNNLKSNFDDMSEKYRGLVTTGRPGAARRNVIDNDEPRSAMDPRFSTDVTSEFGKGVRIEQGVRKPHGFIAAPEFEGHCALLHGVEAAALAEVLASVTKYNGSVVLKFSSAPANGASMFNDRLIFKSAEMYF